MELESYKDGVLLHIGADKGAKLQVNDLLAIIGKAGEDISSLLKSATPAAAPTATATATSTDSKAPQETAAPTPATTPSAHATLDLSKIEEVVLMPRLSDTMEAGVIASWNKQVGDTVKKGEVLAEIETDKATMELESYKNGTLLYIGAQQGEKIPVNGLLCIIGEKGKVDVDAIVAASTSQPLTAAPVATPAATSSTATAVATAVAAPAMATVVSEALPASNGRIIASPLAKKIAQEKGVDLRQLKGSGDGGRIIKSDIDRFQPGSAAPAAATAPAALPVFTGQTTEGYTDIPNSQMRGVIAKRLAESKFTAPHFYLKMEVNMDNAISARTQLNEFSPVKVSFNDMIVKAVSLALREHPAVNASWMGDKIRRYQHVHIGVAVAIEDGLIVPVIRFADQKTLPQIAAETKELASKAKNKKLQPNEFTGNTFTISNLGMMDIDEFTAIINPPDSCIMAVGRISEKIIRKGDSFAATQVMKLTLSCDHRSVDGATGAAFLQTVKRFLENPVRLFL
jgi:pyruvate dehydrogenase E2 component (dihydrolipoamide acetyltransferase)